MSCTLCVKGRNAFCQTCCPHEELEFDEEYYGSDDDGGWGLSVRCKHCGKDYGLSLAVLSAKYKIIKR